jgi:5-formaminoimidazole-4-carboxamide-1-(beta)-D-ribofuranosyl 5'-monophosphate synthetase
MIGKNEIDDVLATYNHTELHLGCIGSHSALEIAHGARAEGFKTVAVCQKGREKTYTTHYADLFDETIVLDRFSDVGTPAVVDRLQRLNTIFVPNRSFSVYVGYDRIENAFAIPLFGSRSLLRAEERHVAKNQFYLLERAGLRYPRRFDDPRDIDRLVMVKVGHAQKTVERGFFTCDSYATYKTRSATLLRKGVITQEDLARARIEEFVVGALFNLDYFYAPVADEVEFLGADQRIETDIEGILHMTAAEQRRIPSYEQAKEYIPIGHRGITVRESQLEHIFEMGAQFVAATKREAPPGIIGPFALQGAFTKDLQFYTFDVSLRVPGAPILLTSSPYMLYKHGFQFSVGRRIAMEIRAGIDVDRLDDCVT